MKITDASVIESHKKNMCELEDGMFAFVAQAQYAIDACAIYTKEEDLFELEVYKRKEEFKDIELYNISCLTNKILENNDFYSLFERVTTEHYSTKESMYARITELMIELNHF